MANKQWLRDRYPILLKQGFWGYCLWCKKPKKKHEAKFCSRKCTTEYQWSKRPEGNRVCITCGKHFRTNPAYIKRRKKAGLYCSRKCFFQRIKPEKEITTIRYGWADAVRERDNYTCWRCGYYNKNNHAHHIATRARRPDLKLDIDNGMTLCMSCHGWVHYHPKEAAKQGFLISGKYPSPREKIRIGSINYYDKKVCKNRTQKCSIEGCNRPYSALGLCKNHYLMSYNEKNKKPKSDKSDWQRGHACKKCQKVVSTLICSYCGFLSI